MEEVFLQCGIQRRKTSGRLTIFFRCIPKHWSFSSVVSYTRTESYPVYCIPQYNTEELKDPTQKNLPHCIPQRRRFSSFVSHNERYFSPVWDTTEEVFSIVGYHRWGFPPLWDSAEDVFFRCWIQWKRFFSIVGYNGEKWCNAEWFFLNFKFLSLPSNRNLVLSYLLLRLLPQWWPWPCCTLCTVHCTSIRSLSPHWLRLSKCFSLTISLRNLQLFVCFFCWKLAIATTALILNTFISVLVFLFALFAHFWPWAALQPSTYFIYQVFVFNPVHLHYFVWIFLMFQPLIALSFVYIRFSYSGNHILLFLGWVPIKPLDLACIFWDFHHDSWQSNPPCRCGCYYPG